MIIISLNIILVLFGITALVSTLSVEPMKGRMRSKILGTKSVFDLKIAERKT